MKEIKAVVQPQRLDVLRQALHRLNGFPGMTVSAVRGAGMRGREAAPRGIKAELVDYSNKVRIEIVATDEMAPEIVALIHGLCHTGRRGDGVIWVSPVDSFVRMSVPPVAN